MFPIGPSEPINNNFSPKEKNKVLTTAEQYLYNVNLIWNRKTTGEYAAWGSTRGQMANDFNMRYWKSGGEMPELIKGLAKLKFKLLTNPNLGNPHLIDNATFDLNKEKTYMCCHDFCFLVLLKSGLVNKQQINDILSIEAASVAAGANISMSDAFYFQPDRIKSIDQDHSPQPGDIVLFKIGERIYHSAIYVSENVIIELGQDAFLRWKDWNDSEFCIRPDTEHIQIYQDENDLKITYCKKKEVEQNQKADMFFIPQEEVAQNMTDFINEYKKKWPVIEMSQGKIVSSLRGTQYKSHLDNLKI